MSFVEFLAEANNSAIVESNAKPNIIIYDYKHDPVDGEHGYKEGDIIVHDDVDVDMDPHYCTLKFSISPVSLKDEDPLAYEVVAAEVEVEFDVASEEDSHGHLYPVFVVSNKAKVKYNILKLDSHAIDNYTNIKSTRDRFEKQLSDKLLRTVAEAVIEDCEDYLNKLHKKAVDKYNDDY